MSSACEDTGPAFLADAMVLGLARWLRVAGFDVSSHPECHDRELVALSGQQGRVLLTRDRDLVTHLRPARAVLLEAARPLEQVRELADALELSAPAELFTRCLRCNRLLRPATREEKARGIPATARDGPGPFRCCPGCGRLYWPGSHTRRMRAALERTMPEWFH